MMENAEVLHTSIPRSMHIEIGTVQDTAQCLARWEWRISLIQMVRALGIKVQQSLPSIVWRLPVAAIDVCSTLSESVCYRVVVVHYHVLYCLAFFVAGLCYLCEAVDSLLYIH